MELFARIAVATASLLSIAIADPASAQSLRDKLIGAWNLDVGSEISQDGKKVVPWSAGSLILDPSSPVGPIVAYFGTYTVNEADNTLTWKVERATNTSIDGATRTQKISFKGDIMTTTGSDVKTPQGPISPVNEWKRVK